MTAKLALIKIMFFLRCILMSLWLIWECLSNKKEIRNCRDAGVYRRAIWNWWVSTSLCMEISFCWIPTIPPISNIDWSIILKSIEYSSSTCQIDFLYFSHIFCLIFILVLEYFFLLLSVKSNVPNLSWKCIGLFWE